MIEERRWKQLLEKLREKQGYASYDLTENELEALDEQIPSVPLGEGQIDSIIASVVRDAPPKHRRPPLRQGSSSNAGFEALEEEVIALHRNEGDCDPDVEKRLRELREEALGEDQEREEE